VEETGPQRLLLCIEAVRRARAWPWQDPSLAHDVLSRLANFHNAARAVAAEPPHWDYEQELAASAPATIASLEACTSTDLVLLRREIGPLRRIVLTLPKLREELLAETPWGRGPIHGDLHTANALIRNVRPKGVPVLVDWGRARIGSPWEDVSSWLQSLGYWEQDTRRIHDQLLKTYLSARGFERRLPSQVRAAYWVAGASNALAGALLYHLAVARDERQTPRRRAQAAHAARDWLRVVRRADAWCS
jgi:Ser/Thr protein kinase RdoA (MazF antagonist)